MATEIDKSIDRIKLEEEEEGIPRMPSPQQYFLASRGLPLIVYLIVGLRF